MSEQDVDDTIDLRVTAANGLETPGARIRAQITREALEGVAFGLEEIANHNGEELGLGT